MDLLGQRYFAESMPIPLFPLSNTFKTCDSPRALSFTSIFEKCGVELDSTETKISTGYIGLYNLMGLASSVLLMCVSKFM